MVVQNVVVFYRGLAHPLEINVTCKTKANFYLTTENYMRSAKSFGLSFQKPTLVRNYWTLMGFL